MTPIYGVDHSQDIAWRHDHTDRRPSRPAHGGRLHESRSGQGGRARRRSRRSSSRPAREAGYVNYDLHQGIEDPGTFIFYENWESSEHLDAHLATPHLVHFAGIMGGLLDENGLTINRVRRIA